MVGFGHGRPVGFGDLAVLRRKRIDDQVEEVGGPDPAVGTLEDWLAQALTSDDDAEALVVAEGGFGVEHMF